MTTRERGRERGDEREERRDDDDERNTHTHTHRSGEETGRVKAFPQSRGGGGRAGEGRTRWSIHRLIQMLRVSSAWNLPCSAIVVVVGLFCFVFFILRVRNWLCSMWRHAQHDTCSRALATLLLYYGRAAHTHTHTHTHTHIHTYWYKWPLPQRLDEALAWTMWGTGQLVGKQSVGSVAVRIDRCRARV